MKLFCAALILSIVVVPSFLLAQVNYAIIAQKNGNLPKAKDIVDSLSQFASFDTDAEFHFIKGLVYESLYFSPDSNIRNLSPNPLKESFDAYTAAKAIAANKKYALAATRQLDSSLAPRLLNEGLLLSGKKKMEEAINMLDMYTQIKPKDTLRYLDIAVAAEKIGRYDVAKKNYNKVMASSKKTPFVYKSMFFILREEKTFDEAAKILKKGKALYPTDKDFYKLEINLMVDNKKFLQALSMLDTTMQIDPANKEVYLYDKGAIFQLQDSTDTALHFYNQSLEVNPNYFDSNFNIAGIFYERARKVYEKINALNYGEYQKSGKRLEEKGHNFARQALPYFEKCYSLDPKNTIVKGYLFDLYRNLKMKDKAKEFEAFSVVPLAKEK